jgi:hypothetical protein
MRKPVFLTLLGAVIALSGVFYFIMGARTKGPGERAASNPEAAAPAYANLIVAPGAGNSPDFSNVHVEVQANLTRRTPPAEDDAAAVKGEQLMELAAGDSPGALQAIVAELNNGNPDVRKSAVDATVQLGDTNAIPWLEAAAQWTQSADERTEILDAVEFLKLPKLESRTEGRRLARAKTVSNTPKSPKLQP